MGMTRERIEDIREIVLPFVRDALLKINYENLGKSDAEEFTRDFNEILNLAIKALEQEPKTGHWIMQERIYDAMLEIMKYEHEGFINISLARLDEILKKCGVEDGNDD